MDASTAAALPEAVAPDVAALRADPQDASRWLRLARALRALGDERACALFDYGPSVGLPVEAARAARDAFGAPSIEALGGRAPLTPLATLCVGDHLDVSPTSARALIGDRDRGWVLIDWSDVGSPCLTARPDLAEATRCAWLNDDTILCADDARAWLAASPRAPWSLPASARALLRLSGERALIEAQTFPWHRAYLLDLTHPVASPLPEASSVHAALSASAPWGEDALICCGGGVQSSEVRFAFLNGAWLIKTAHQRDVRAVLSVPSTQADGPRGLSLDSGGYLLGWSPLGVSGPPRARARGVIPDAALPPQRARWRAAWDEVRRALILGGEEVSARPSAPWGVSVTDVEAPDDAPWRATTLRRVAPLRHPWAALACDHGGRWLPFDLRTRCLIESWRAPLALMTSAEVAALQARLGRVSGADARIFARPQSPLPPWLTAL
jgi:hypothetical protein